MIEKSQLDAWERRLATLNTTWGLPPYGAVVKAEVEVLAELSRLFRDLGYDYLPALVDAAVARARP